MNIFYPFKNSSGKKNFPSFFKLFVTLLLCLAGVQGIFAQNLDSQWTFASDISDWGNACGKPEYTFIRKDILLQYHTYTHYLDLEFANDGVVEYKLLENCATWYGMSTTIPYACKEWVWSNTDAGNTKFQHHAGKYRLYVDANSKKITVSGIFVTTDKIERNSNGSYTITGHFTNSNPSEQMVNLCSVVFSQGSSDVLVGINSEGTRLEGESNINQAGETFTVTTGTLNPVLEYSFKCKVVDGTVGEHFSESITFTPGQDPQYSATITATPGTGNVTLASTLTESVAGTDLSSATCEFQYKLESDGDEAYAVMTGNDMVSYSGEGATRTATLSQDMAAGDYVFRAVWTYNSTEVANAVTETVTIPSDTPVFKDIWFRSSIVENGWGDDISDPIGEGVNPKYKGQTTDGKIYIWDWSGSNAVTVDSGIEFKFGEYTGSSSWGNSGYAPNGQSSVTSADFGTEISVQVATGNFSVGEKITITKITLDTENLTLVLEGEQYQERFPVTVNVVNGENGSVVIDPVDITNMAVGETVTVTATPNEGYTVVFEATSGVTMADGNSDNEKVFTIIETTPVITVTFQIGCSSVEPDFAISGRFNAGFEDDVVQYAGTAINSGDVDPKDGIWSDGSRYIQLTANSVAANYFEWECVRYAIDGSAVEPIPDIAWTGNTTTSARAELSLPGTYTFVCNAKCNLGDEWTQSAELTITAPVPAMGFDGVGIVDSNWDHTSAGREGEGLMIRQNGSLVWKSRSLNVSGFDNDAQFVIIQQYKRYGCTPNNGWNGWDECQSVIGNDWGNKINGSDLTFSYVKWENDAKGSNFLPVNAGTWVDGADGTDLQLVVTMTDYDSYKVELVEYQNTIAVATTEPADGSWGTVSMTAPDGITVIESGSNVADYVGQQITVTADPVEGYRVKKWVINGTEYVNSNTSYAPTVTEQGLNVVVYFERACNSVYVYEITGGGTICRNGGSTEITMNTLKNTSYQLYKDGDVCGKAVAGTGSKQVWKVTEGGTYTVKGYDTTYPECSSQAVDMTGEVVVTAVDKLDITLTPGSGIALSVLQTRTAKSDVPVDWEISVAVADGGGGDFCNDDNHYLIVSKDDLNIAYKVACLGKATLKATMKAPNDNCSFEATMDYNGTENEVCATIE